MFEVALADIENGTGIVEFLAEKTGITQSKGEARRMLKEGSIAINKQKAGEDTVIDSRHLMNGSYILVQRGKKNYYLVQVK